MVVGDTQRVLSRGPADGHMAVAPLVVADAFDRPTASRLSARE